MTKKQRGIAVTERDLDMFESLATARYLTTQGIEWLHYAGWQERQARHEERQQLVDPAQRCRYKPSRLLYNRLGRLCEARLIRRTVRTVPRASAIFRREPDLYALTETGALMLAERRGTEPGRLWYERRADQSAITLDHAAAIGMVYAALRSKLLMRPDLTLQRWVGDHVLSKKGNHDRVQLGVGRWAGIIPDAMFLIRTAAGAELLYFLELDRGRHISTWREKVRAYAVYQGSPALRSRYGVERFSLLTVTTSDHQRRRMMEATAQELGGKPAGYYFTELALVSPLTIGQVFVVESVLPTRTELNNRSIMVYKVEREKPYVWLS